MDALRTELTNLLRGGQAFEPFDTVLDSFEPQEYGLIPTGAEHSAWQIVEHMRISQRDILDFIQNENGTYVQKDWPKEYWPQDADPGPRGWNDSVDAIKSGIIELEKIIADEGRDLFKPFPWGSGQNLLREIQLVAEHSAYHVGELIELQRWIRANQPNESDELKYLANIT